MSETKSNGVGCLTIVWIVLVILKIFNLIPLAWGWLIWPAVIWIVFIIILVWIVGSDGRR